MIKKMIFITVFFIVCSVAVILLWNGLTFAASAEENYKWYCTQCHGMDGKGSGPNAKPKSFGIDLPEIATTPRDHTNLEEMSKLSDADIQNAIAGGGASVSKSALMPAWGRTLKESEIKDLVAYLRKLCKCTGR